MGHWGDLGGVVKRAVRAFLQPPSLTFCCCYQALSPLALSLTPRGQRVMTARVIACWQIKLSAAKSSNATGDHTIYIPYTMHADRHIVHATTRHNTDAELQRWPDAPKRPRRDE